MPVASIFNIPESPESLAQWSFPHMDHHRNLNNYLEQKFTVQLPLYPLDPVNPNDMSTWLYQHQQLHTLQNQLLNINGQNLLEVDWNDPTQRAEWVFLNATEHQKAALATGVG